jgi:hypothetical protein
VDTEGNEMSVFLGAATTLRQTKVVVWECGWFRDGGSMHAAVHLLHEAGFETLLLTNRLPLRVPMAHTVHALSLHIKCTLLTDDSCTVCAAAGV